MKILAMELLIRDNRYYSYQAYFDVLQETQKSVKVEAHPDNYGLLDYRIRIAKSEFGPIMFKEGGSRTGFSHQQCNILGLSCWRLVENCDKGLEMELKDDMVETAKQEIQRRRAALDNMEKALVTFTKRGDKNGIGEEF